jgi:hypothetical protein
MKVEIKLLNKIIFFLITGSILMNMLLVKAQRYGDGNEYFLMMESLGNHLSPELRPGDIKHTYVGDLNAFGEKADPYWGYFEGKGGRRYSQHFWAYSLFCLPAKIVLEFFGLKINKSLQVTNALLFALALFFILVSKLEEKQKLAFMLLLTFSPALWFIHWTHPEIFILCLVTVSLTCLQANKNGASILFAVIASFQNQVLALYVFYLFLKSVFSSPHKIKNFIQYGLLSALVLLPNAFYYLTFGRFNPLSGATAMANISPFRVFELFFDLNLGLLRYIPIALLLFFGIIIFRTYKEGVFNGGLQILIVTIALLTACTATENWNHGTSGPSRYVIWILPFIFYVLVINLETLRAKSLKVIFLSALAVQVIIVVSAGPVVHEEDYLKHSAAAEFVLNRFPFIYNPSFEIFGERTQHSESDWGNPTIYKRDGKCRKALVTCDGLNTLKSVCGEGDRNFQEFCRSHKGEWFYVNY